MAQQENRSTRAKAVEVRLPQDIFSEAVNLAKNQLGKNDDIDVAIEVVQEQIVEKFTLTIEQFTGIEIAVRTAKNQIRDQKEKLAFAISEIECLCPGLVLPMTNDYPFGSIMFKEKAVSASILAKAVEKIRTERNKSFDSFLSDKEKFDKHVRAAIEAVFPGEKYLNRGVLDSLVYEHRLIPKKFSGPVFWGMVEERKQIKERGEAVRYVSEKVMTLLTGGKRCSDTVLLNIAFEFNGRVLSSAIVSEGITKGREAYALHISAGVKSEPGKKVKKA